MVSYDKQSVLEGTREFYLVTFIMLIQFVFATLIIWYVGGPVLRCCSYLNKPPIMINPLASIRNYKKSIKNKF